MDYNSVINENFIEEIRDVLEKIKPSNILEVLDIIQPNDVLLGIRKSSSLRDIEYNFFTKNYFDSARIILDDYDVLEYGKLENINIKLIHRRKLEDYISELEEVIVMRPRKEPSKKFNTILELLIGKKISELDSLKTIHRYIKENYTSDNYFIEEFFLNNSIINILCSESGLCGNLSPLTEETHTSDIFLNSDFDVISYSKGILNEDIKEKVKRKMASKIYNIIDNSFKEFSKCSLIINRKKKLNCKIDKVNKLIQLNRKLYRYIPTDRRKEQILNKIEKLEIRKNKYNDRLRKIMNKKRVISKNLRKF